jgi:hypothetical protein
VLAASGDSANRIALKRGVPLGCNREVIDSWGDIDDWITTKRLKYGYLLRPEPPLNVKRNSTCVLILRPDATETGRLQDPKTLEPILKLMERHLGDIKK